MSDAAMEQNELGGVSRRTILQGAAWSVPAVMATQLPAWATTGTPPDVSIDFGQSTACKIPGSSWNSGQNRLCYDKGYVLWAQIVNSLAVPVTITGVVPGTMLVGGVPQCVIGIVDPALLDADPTVPGPVTIAAGESYTVGVFSNASSDSSSTTVQLQLAYTVEGIDETTPTLSGQVTGSPWTTGGGSCSFPSNASSPRRPPSACDATGPNC